MSGISRMIAKQLSASLGITDNPKYNPMFKQTEEVLTDVADPSDPTVARFYSPLESAIDEAPIGKEGTRGENIEAFVRKRAPKVTQGEMEYRGLGLEPGELYTAESAKEGLGGLEVKATKVTPIKYKTTQRQSFLEDKETDYVELSIESEDDLGLFTHFGPSNLAHTRYSVRGIEQPALKTYPQFSEEALEVAKKQNDKSREIVVDMPIKHFLKAAEDGIEIRKLKNTVELAEKGTKFDSIPSLTFKNNGDGTAKVTGHDGRHRAWALKKIGVQTMPVRLVSQGGDGPAIRWGQQNDPTSFDYVDKLPSYLIQEKGEISVPMPKMAHPTVIRGSRKPYILIEELQSDPLQNVVDDLPKFKKKQRKTLDTDLNRLYREAEYLIETEGSGFPDKPIKELKSYIEDVVIPTRLNKKLSREDRIDVFKKAAKERGVKEEYLFGDTGSISRVAGALLRKEYDGSDYEIDAISDAMYNSVETYLGSLTTAITKKDLPIQKLTDTVRLSLQAIIADAKAKGIDEIVLPPVEQLAEKRFRADEVSEKISKGSAFYNTYVTAYNKALKQLKAELGNQVEIGKKKLVYRDVSNPDYDYNNQLNKTVEGTLLDISNLTIDPSNIKLRFNKGGLVERRTK